MTSPGYLLFIQIAERVNVEKPNYKSDEILSKTILETIELIKDNLKDLHD